MEDFEAIHPRLKGFNSFYIMELAHKLEGFEAERKVAQGKALKIAVPALLFGLPAALNDLLFPGLVGEWSEEVGFAGGGGVLGGLFFAYRRVQKVAAASSDFLAEAVCTFLGLRFRAAPSDFSIQTFQSHDLLPAYDKLDLEDWISGQAEGLAFEVCEARLTEEYRDKDGDRRTRTIFWGPVMSISLARPVGDEILITPDGGFLGNFFKGLFETEERLELDAPAFERVYQVYAKDRARTRGLLTGAFMEFLVDLAERFGEAPRMVFSGRRLLLSVDTRKNHFEAGGAFSNLADPNHLRRLLRDVLLLFEIVENLPSSVRDSSAAAGTAAEA